MYNILNTTTDYVEKTFTFKILDAKITRLHLYELHRIFLDTDERDTVPLSLHRAKTRRGTRNVSTKKQLRRYANDDHEHPTHIHLLHPEGIKQYFCRHGKYQSADQKPKLHATATIELSLRSYHTNG